jgi:SNF family Na+-dependent transporter
MKHVSSFPSFTSNCHSRLQIAVNCVFPLFIISLLQRQKRFFKTSMTMIRRCFFLLVAIVVSTSAFSMQSKATTTTTTTKTTTKKSNHIVASIALISTLITTPTLAFDPSDYASETVTQVITELRNSQGKTADTFKAFEDVAAIITEGKGVGGAINYSK